jgi:hypothetical protein
VDLLDRPSVGELRARLGKPPRQTPNLQAAVDCEAHAWMLYQYVIAHLMYAQRVTNPATAAFVVQETLHEWAEAELDYEALGDELVAEAADYRSR